MMSVTPVNAGAASSGYYKTEGYYAAGTDEGDAAASWFGKAADRLGLQGRVDDAMFTNILEGQTFIPGKEGPKSDKIMGKIIDGERKHRPGMDLTFSAPKSVSIAALVYGDKRLIEAHDKAVKTAMQYIEDNLVQTRRFKSGSLEVETGGKIIAGLFRHDTSRALDPQLHTHAVIANMVENTSGNFTALHNDLLFRTQKLGSEIYRNELARGAQEAGYTVERVGKERMIELKEIPDELVKGFSKRSSEIEAVLKERDMKHTAKTAELAALATRAAKHGIVDRDQLRDGWLKEAKELGIDENLMKDVRSNTEYRKATRLPGVTRDGVIPASLMADAKESLTKAIGHISERNVSYTETDLLTTAIGFAEKADITAIKQAVNEAKREGTLILLNDTNTKTQLLTDKDSLALEREMSRIYRTGMRTRGVTLAGYVDKNGKADRTPETTLQKRLGYTTLSEGQQAAIKVSLTGKGQVVGVQGYAGTGKTFMLAHLAKEAQRAGYKIEGLAPSNQAVAQLKDALPSSETLQARLLRQRSADKEADPQKTMLVVDEASMVSTKQMTKLLQQASDQKIARVVLVGDVQQLDGVSAGTPFDLLQKLQMRTAVMDDIQRQRDGDTLAVVKHAIAGEVQQAFEKIGKGIVKAEDIAHQTASTYLSTAPDERKNLGLVTPTNRVREAINEHIRDGLKADGTLTGTERILTTLSPFRLTRIEASEPRSYRTGDVVIPHQSVASAGLAKGHMYDVIEVQTEKGRVMLQDREGSTPLPFSPTQNSKASAAVDLYEEKKRGFSAGDKVKFRISDDKQNIKNGQTGEITSIENDKIYLKDGEGTRFQVDQGTLAATGLDHAYALTTHDFQGATVDKIVVAMAANEQLANQKSFYVAVSRARDEVTLITDKPDQLAERLEAQTGEKISALESYVETEKQRLAEKAEAAEKELKPEPDKADEITANKDTDKPKDDNQPSMADLYKDLQEAMQKQRGDFER